MPTDPGGEAGVRPEMLEEALRLEAKGFWMTLGDDCADALHKLEEQRCCSESAWERLFSSLAMAVVSKIDERSLGVKLMLEDADRATRAVSTIWPLVFLFLQESS